jgi:hypothetical protein
MMQADASNVLAKKPDDDVIATFVNVVDSPIVSFDGMPEDVSLPQLMPDVSFSPKVCGALDSNWSSQVFGSHVSPDIAFDAVPGGSQTGPNDMNIMPFNPIAFNSPPLIADVDGTASAPPPMTIPGGPGFNPIQIPASNESDATSDEPKRKRPRTTNNESSTTLPDAALDPEQLAKRLKRRQRNKESAQQSRQRKKLYMDELQQQAQALHADNVALQRQVRSLMSQNEALKMALFNHGIPFGGPIGGADGVSQTPRNMRAM